MGNCFDCECCLPCCNDEEMSCDCSFTDGQSGKTTMGKICFSLFYYIFATSLVSAGVLVGYYPEKVDSILFYVQHVTGHDFVPNYQLMIAMGALLLIPVLCACCFCCCIDNCATRFTVFAFLCFLATFIMVFVVIGLLSHSVHTFDSGSMESKIKMDLLAKINSSARTDFIWDRIQQKFKCCGVENPSDWQHNTFYGNGTVPDSCCRVETPKCGQNYRPQAIVQNGCITDMMDKVTVYFYWQIGFLTFFSIIAFVTICFLYSWMCE